MVLRKTPLAVVILAAGKGTRMKSNKPKVMHELLGLPMINWLIGSVDELKPDRIIVVTGKGMKDLESAVAPYQTVIQEKQEGTGSALMAAMPALQDFEGDVVVLLGDTPLLSTASMRKLISARHTNAETGLSVLGVQMDDPTGYGRLLLNEKGELDAIREEKDANRDEKLVNTVNTGAFCLDSAKIEQWLAKMGNDNAQNEYYITDLPEIAAREGVKTYVAVTKNADEVRGCNTRLDLAYLEKTAQVKMREHLIMNGVVMHDMDSVYLHHDTEIGVGTTIEPNVFFGPKVVVGENVTIKAFCHFENSTIGSDTAIGPYARLRPGSEIGVEVRIGNFVEVKKSVVGNRSKVSHLSYVGDTIMGEDVNFGCGAVTVNYDGFDKYQTRIGDGVMVGCNVNLIAPVLLENGSFIAAGSTITTDVPADALSVERGKAQVREGWVEQYRKRKAKEKSKS